MFNAIQDELNTKTIDIKNILKAVDEYQKDNIDTIEKLRKEKKVELTKINGALKMSIHSHGPITKELIGSASKRIYGALIVNPNTKPEFNPISFRDLIIGIGLGMLIFIVLFAY